MMVKEEFTMPTSGDNPIKKRSENQPDNKDRTLFCINIDAKCSEDILYELFLQAGPIEQIKRKEDKNGNLICLITYKHAVSCDYAINIFNGISLFGTALKVQLSQQPGQGAGGNERRRQSTNNYQNIGRDRDQSYQRDQGYQRDQRESRRQVSYDNMTPTESPAGDRNLNSLMAQQFSEFGTVQSFANPYSDLINRNMGTNFNFEGNNDNNGHQSRRNHSNNYNGGGGNYNNSRGNSRGYSNDNRGGGGDMWRNQSNNGRHNNGYNSQRNGSYDNRNQSRDNNSRNKDRSRSPHEQRRQQRNRY